MTSHGILAVWNDCRPGSEDAYEAWYRGEHLRERVAVPGFICGRRYVSLTQSSPRYFTAYLTETPDVLRSPAYLERGANPTPMTRHIMSTVFQNMIRTVCRRARCEGEAEGAIAVVVRAKGDDVARIEQAWPMACALERRIRTELWLSDEAANRTPSEEEQIRGRDQKIDACLVIEFTEPEHAIAASAALTDHFRTSTDAGIAVGNYRLICSLQRRDLVGL